MDTFADSTLQTLPQSKPDRLSRFSGKFSEFLYNVEVIFLFFRAVILKHYKNVRSLHETRQTFFGIKCRLHHDQASKCFCLNVFLIHIRLPLIFELNEIEFAVFLFQRIAGSNDLIPV